MATLFKNSRGGFQIQFVRPDGSRTSIRLGAVARRQAEHVKWFLEDLIAARETGTSPSAATTAWVARASDKVRKHLARLGLAEAPTSRQVPTLAEWLRTYIDSRGDVKDNTRSNYLRSEQQLLAFFNGTVRIDQVTAGQAEEFRIWLKGTRKLADATVTIHCRHAKQFFTAAVGRALIAGNPFAHLRCGSGANPARSYFVTREEAEAVLKACTTAEWRLIFALCRYGGLRCPSEIVTLRWKDVDWARKRFTVHAPKTARYENGGVRHVPIFPELYPHLRAVFEKASKDTEWVITRYRRLGQNLGNYLRFCMQRAGLRIWPKLYQNLRSTRETELAEEFPLHVVCAWIGNSRKVAMKHYLQVTESHFAKATAVASASPTPKPLPVLPDELARGWADLPEDAKKAILALAATASPTQS